MEWIQIKVFFEAADAGLAADLIAGLFYDLGVKGVVMDDPDLEPPEGWGEDAREKPERHAVAGYFPNDPQLEGHVRELLKGLARLEAELPLWWRVVREKVDEEDWAESWKAFFRPQKISGRMVIKPSWQPYSASAGEMVIEIDPGMAFGTGTHPTTMMCLNLLETHLHPGDTLLDVGTGSGILMIAAAKLGAGRVFGIDNDAMAAAIARRNLLLNSVSPELFAVAAGSLLEPVKGRFRIIVANILAEVILTLLDGVPGRLVPGGILICSGIIGRYRDAVLEKMEARGLERLEVRETEGWVAAAGRFPS